MPLSEQDLIEEQIHFSNVVSTFEQYAKYAVYTFVSFNHHEEDALLTSRDDRSYPRIIVVERICSRYLQPIKRSSRI
jgi:hypothetical protein